MIKTCYRGMIKDDEPGYFSYFCLSGFHFQLLLDLGLFGVFTSFHQSLEILCSI